MGEDEELLKKANEEYEIEKDKKEKENASNKNKNKAPLAIEAPPGTMEPKVSSALVAPMAASQNDVLPNGVWRNGIPRSRSEEDEELARAIAASIGQEYVPTKKRSSRVTNHAVTVEQGSISGINNHNSLHSVKHEIEEFVERPEVTYEEALDILLNKECCFGLYDFNINQWRTAILMRQFDKNKRIMVRYTQESSKKMTQQRLTGAKFCTIKEFPSKCIMKDPERFKITKRDLTDQSIVPKELVEAWEVRQKVAAKKQKNKKTN